MFCLDCLGNFQRSMQISKITLKVIALERGLLILYSDGNIIVTTSSSSAVLVVEVVSTNFTNRTSMYMCERRCVMELKVANWV